jgi:outer membrane protein OmpA-like peptidoglycan-associated protein
MNRPHTPFLLMAALLALSGCNSAFIQLKAIDPQANDYPSALAAEYLAYATSELEQGHITAAERFADKGMRSHKGEPPPPEIPPETLPKARYDALMAARRDLFAVQTEDMKRVAAQKVARAQILYDCWEQQAATVENEVAPCGEEFRSVIADLQVIADSFIYGQETEHAVKFAPGSAKLTPRGRTALTEIIDRASCIANYKLEIQAHQGGKKSPAPLMQKRAQALRAAFIAKRVPAENVIIKTKDDGHAVYLSSDDDKPDKDALQVVIRTFAW